MIPCLACGADASTGWVHGFVPSPDSLKMGLCRERHPGQPQAGQGGVARADGARDTRHERGFRPQGGRAAGVAA